MASSSPLLTANSEIPSAGSVDSESLSSSGSAGDGLVRDGDLRVASLLGKVQQRAARWFSNLWIPTRVSPVAARSPSPAVVTGVL